MPGENVGICKDLVKNDDRQLVWPTFFFFEIEFAATINVYTSCNYPLNLDKRIYANRQQNAFALMGDSKIRGVHKSNTSSDSGT